MPGPITPKEAANKKKAYIPEPVFEAFNQLIVKNLSGNCAIVSQSQVVSVLCTRVNPITKKVFSPDEIFENGYLNVEELYSEAGWRVEYDKPGYNEDYGAFFKFSRLNNG